MSNTLVSLLNSRPLVNIAMFRVKDDLIHVLRGLLAYGDIYSTYYRQWQNEVMRTHCFTQHDRN